jgi:gamma-carbonic anhydrase
MAFIQGLKGKAPVFGDNCWLAENAVIVGDVICGKDCTFWFHSVVRGDVNSIVLGHKVNVQDGAILHVSYQTAKLKIGDNVSIGHRAMVHGCTIEDNVLIGMGAIVMDHAIVGKNSIIAAGAVVLENTVIEPNSLYAGVPARRIRTIEGGKNQEMIERIANNYRMYASWYKEEK